MSTIRTTQVNVDRWTVTSAASFETILARIEREIGHPEMSAFWQKTASTVTLQELEDVVNGSIGPAGLMEFVRFDHGGILAKVQESNAGRILRLVIGNPLIMREMAKHVSDAGSYAPVTVLIHDRPDGVHLSYDRMASLLAPYRNSAALKVARDLDAKIEAMLTKAAS